MKQIYVANLIEHLAVEIEEQFYLKNIYLKETKDIATPYLLLKLQDKTGSIWGRIWDKNIKDEYLNLKGTVITVHGEVILNKYQQPEFVICKIEGSTEYDIGQFINGLSPVETDKFVQVLNKQIGMVKHKGYKELLDSLFSSDMQRFKEAPASLSKNGSYNGGLLVQTVNVTSISLQIMRSLSAYDYHPGLKINYQPDLLITGSLLYGIGIMNLYTPFPEAEKISESVLLPKQILSMQVIEHALQKDNIFLTPEEKNLLIHLIYVAYDNDTTKAANRESLILHMAHKIYMDHSSLEYFIKCNQDSIGAVYDKKLNNYLYFQKSDIKGGN